MKTIHGIIAAAGALSFVQTPPASAAQTDPDVIIYRFPGVRDDGQGNGVGVATVFHCTNFSGAQETLRFVTRNHASAIESNVTAPIPHLFSVTVSTHANFPYSSDAFLNTGEVVAGTTAIAATSPSIICTAMTIDAANPKPDGVALRGIRFNPVPGSQE